MSILTPDLGKTLQKCLLDYLRPQEDDHRTVSVDIYIFTLRKQSVWLSMSLTLSFAASQELTFCDLARDGRECSITCNSTDLTETVIFYKDDIRKASCDVVPGLPSAVCVVTVSDRYSIEQSGNTSQTILHIKKVSRVHDTGEWSCSVGKSDGQSKLLQIYGMKMSKEKGRTLIKRNFISRKEQQKQCHQSVWVHNVRTVSWSNYSNPTGVVNRFTDPAFPVHATIVQSKWHRLKICSHVSNV